MKLATKKGTDPEDRQEYFTQSAAHYTQSAEVYLKDDEYYVMFLKVALEAHWYGQSPLKVTLPICKQIREALPDVNKIWEYSQNANARNQSMKMVSGFEKHSQVLLSQGKVTLESVGELDSSVVCHSFTLRSTWL